MNKRVKKKWIAALRGGKYKQGTGCLRRNVRGKGPSYCCLGVLCDLHAKEIGHGWYKGHYLGKDGWLPEGVMNWAEINHPCGELPITDQRLSSVNDDGASFEEIADKIDRQL